MNRDGASSIVSRSSALRRQIDQRGLTGASLGGRSTSCIHLSIAAIMPGRRTTRSSVPSSPRKSLAARPSSSHRVSTPHFVIPSERPSSDLRVRICGIFADAQASTAGHRKLVIKLRKVQGECCYSTSDKEDEDAADEERFNEEMGRCVVRLMGVKKSEGAGDRVVRFLGLFLKHASEDGPSRLSWQLKVVIMLIYLTLIRYVSTC